MTLIRRHCNVPYFVDYTSIMLQSWWSHQMESFSALLSFCAGNSPVPVNSSHKGQWRGALMFSLICASINDWVNNREAGKLRRHRGHYDVNVMAIRYPIPSLERLTFLETYAYWGVIEAVSLRELSVRYRSDTRVSDRYLIDVDPRAFALWGTIAKVRQIHNCEWIVSWQLPESWLSWEFPMSVNELLQNA